MQQPQTQIQQQPQKTDDLNQLNSQFRLKTLKAFIEAGIPVSKIDSMRSYLEEISDCSLTSSTHLYSDIEILRKDEKQRLMNLIQGKKVTLIFDGTPHRGEAFGILVRFIHNYELKHQLLSFKIISGTVDYEAILGQLYQVVFEYRIERDLILSTNHQKTEKR